MVGILRKFQKGILKHLVSFLHILFFHFYPHLCASHCNSHTETEIHFHFALQGLLLPIYSPPIFIFDVASDILGALCYIFEVPLNEVMIIGSIFIVLSANSGGNLFHPVFIDMDHGEQAPKSPRFSHPIRSFVISSSTFRTQQSTDYQRCWLLE